MPNIWTHIIFGEELMNEVGLANVLADQQMKQIFNLGCQGPDILFYHNFWPWKDSSFATQLANTMHLTECGPFLLQLFKTVQNKPLKDPSVLYAIGFLTHHILDRTMHPFVFYHSGFTPFMHQRFEIIMDTLIVKRKLGKDTWRSQTWKLLDYDPQLLADIPVMMHQTAKLFYPELSEHVTFQVWQQSYRDLIRAQKIFYDPYRIKTALTFGLLEPYVYKRKLAPIDYLNEEHAVWNCPTSLSETYTLSVWDLWENARQDGARMLVEVLQVFQDARKHKSVDYTRLTELLGDISYDSGKPCNSGLEIVHVKSLIG